ncbi:MAG: glycosyltransferase family 4 protein [Dehalococcoidales bacterium]|nr:glycosyltransferase family 4 protein [Dehalococcoidales bacterium]
MNIGVVHWAYPPMIGGVETHLATIYPEIARMGMDVYLLTARQKGVPDREKIFVDITRSDILSPAFLETMKKEGRDISDYVKPILKDFLTSNKIDIIHAHNLHMDYLPLSKALVEVCHELEIPCVVVLHNDIFIDRETDEMIGILTEVDWDRIVVISEFIKSSVGKRIPAIPEEKFQVIMHGIDTDSFSPASREKKMELRQHYGFGDNRIILHTARFLQWKGIVPAIKSLPSIIDQFSDAKMVFTGRQERVSKIDLAEYEREIDRTIAELKLENNIVIGSYSYSDIPKLTQLADVVIYTTIGNEPFGLVPIEAMASGVPAIVTGSGGLLEGVIDGQTGFIIDRDEQNIPGQLAASIAKLFSNPELAREMGLAGRKRAVEVFDKKRMAADFISMSDSLLS